MGLVLCMYACVCDREYRVFVQPFKLIHTNERCALYNRVTYDVHEKEEKTNETIKCTEQRKKNI